MYLRRDNEQWMYTVYVCRLDLPLQIRSNKSYINGLDKVEIDP